MTVEHGSSLDGTETASESSEVPHADEDGRPPPAAQGSARLPRLAAIRHSSRRYLARWRSIVATTLVVAAVGVAAGVYFVLYLPDQRVDDAAAHRAIQAASDGAVAVLSYSYDHLNRDFDNAKSHLTGDFLTYYNRFTDNVVAPTAQQGQLTASAKVIRAAISDLHPDSAVVLVFVDQTTASTKKKDPEKTQSAVRVTLTKVDGSWLIAKFDPVA
jgi:Mce-associated membrane protein